MKTTIAKILKNDVVTNYGFPVSYTEPDGTVLDFDVFTNDTFRQVGKQLFGARVYDDWEVDGTEADCIIDFKNSFTEWKKMRADTYGRRMYALSIKFNPLENYNGHEESKREFEHGESVELSFENRKDTQKDDTFTERSYTDYEETTKDDSYTERSYTDYEEAQKDDTSTTRTYTALKEQMNNAQITTSHSVSADDSSSYVPESQDTTGQHTDEKTTSGSYTDSHTFTNGNVKEISGSYKDQNGFTNGNVKEISGSYKDQRGGTNGITNEKAGKETTAHSGKDTESYTLDRAGNLGVTTSQQMLASDLDMLRYDIAMIAIKEFISTYTYLSMEVDYGN